MPKAVQYQKGSIIYFEGDKDDRIFILQSGVVILTSTDIGTGVTNTTQLSMGEFFGVKSALGQFPREETATVLQDASTISMTVSEFETIFSNNKQVVYKMLRVFSGQLREYHKKSKMLLTNYSEPAQDEGMLSVAKCFYKEEMYQPCMDVCVKYLKRFPNAPDKEQVAKLFDHSKKYAEKLAARAQDAIVPISSMQGGALAAFMLPAFERFQKKYSPGNVIICEFEPGDSFYLIQSGEVQLVKCVNETIKNLDVLKPGEFFGEMAILDNSPRSATCIAKSPVQCLEFNKANFEVLIAGNPQIALILLKLFCKRIYDQKRRYRILTLKDPQSRIADVFCMYDEMDPSPRPAEKGRQFNITAQDIVQWSGLQMSVVQDELQRLKSKNKVEVYDKYMVVSNIADMRHSVEVKLQQRR